MTVKRYALRISSSLGEGEGEEEMDKRDVSKKRKVVPEGCAVACIYSDRADGT